MNTYYQKQIREKIAKILTFKGFKEDPNSKTMGMDEFVWQSDQIMALLQQSNKEAEEALLGHVELWLLRLQTEPDKWTVRQALRSLCHPEEVHTDPDLEGRI